MTPHHLLIIITAALQSSLNQAALTYDPTGGQFTFTVPLYPAAGPHDTPTFYWACTPMSDEVYQQVTAAYATAIQSGAIKVYSVREDDPQRVEPYAVLAQLGLTTAPDPLGNA